MKLSNINNISFQKQLVAKCAVLKNGKTCQCPIYILDDDEKKEYITNMQKDKNWRINNYLSIAYYDSQLHRGEYDLYVMEDDNKCLGYAEVENSNDVKVLNILEVSRSYNTRNNKRNIKYIGQSLMAFLAALSKKEHILNLKVSKPSTSALDFYERSCGFKRTEQNPSLHLNKANYDTLIKANGQKTGKKVELTG